ncbi:hypothetical protein BC827DRAFT_1268033 [Russula dissimulans]|nr:hypothetical protein BC827DRAFT_1268033 [Russula dissimulans]
MAFVSSHGGEDVVRTAERLLKQLATIAGENLTPSILRVTEEGAEEAFKTSFMPKFKFTLEQRIEESQETILNALKSGPYELIHNSDVKEIWKDNLDALDTELKGFGEESEWDSEDEWTLEDNAGGYQVAENEDISGAAERELY